MKHIWTLGFYGFLQLVRSRIYLNVIVAGVFLVVAALAFEELSGGASGRVLMEVGLAFIALVTAALAGITAITMMTKEIESKQIHLVLARPISRVQLVLGRFLTIALLVIASNLILGAMLAGLIVVTGGDGAGRTFIAAQFASLEGFVVAAIALLFGVGSSSTMSALFTVTLFVLGRLTLPLFELIEASKFNAPLEVVLTGVYWVLPHLFAFDATAWAHAPSTSFAWVQNFGYGVLVIVCLLSFASFRMERRDVL